MLEQPRPPQKRHLDTPTKAAMWDLIRLHCKKTEDGFAVYDPGWSDERIAAAIPGSTIHMVRDARQKLVGLLRPRGEPFGERVIQLEARLYALEQWARQGAIAPFTPRYEQPALFETPT
jgi:hypothetical protein